MEREKLQNRIDLLSESASRSADALNLSDRDVRKSGINPVTREAISSKDRGISGALNLIGKDITVGLDESDTAGRSLLGQLGTGAFQFTAGSKGIASTFQTTGEGLAAEIGSRKLGSQTQEQIDNTTRILEAARKTKDPDTKKRILESLSQSNESFNGLIDTISDQAVSTKDAITSSIQTASGVANLAIGGQALAGKSLAATPFLSNATRNVVGQSAASSALRTTAGLVAQDAAIGTFQDIATAIDEREGTFLDAASSLNIKSDVLAPLGLNTVSSAVLPALSPLIRGSLRKVGLLGLDRREALTNAITESKELFNKRIDSLAGETNPDIIRQQIVDDLTAPLNKISKDLGAEDVANLEQLADILANTISGFDDTARIKGIGDIFFNSLEAKNPNILENAIKRFVDEQEVANGRAVASQEAIAARDSASFYDAVIEEFNPDQQAIGGRLARVKELQATLSSATPDQRILIDNEIQGIVNGVEQSVANGQISQENLDQLTQAIEARDGFISLAEQYESQSFSSPINQTDADEFTNQAVARNTLLPTQNLGSAKLDDIKVLKQDRPVKDNENVNYVRKLEREVSATIKTQLVDEAAVIKDLFRQDANLSGLDESDIFNKLDLAKGTSASLTEVDLGILTGAKTLAKRVGKKIFREGNPRTQVIALADKYAVAKHSVDVYNLRGEGYAPISVEQARADIREVETFFEAAGQLDSFMKIHSDMTQIGKNVLERLRSSKTITETDYKNMSQYKNYVPIQRTVDGVNVDIIAPDSVVDGKAVHFLTGSDAGYDGNIMESLPGYSRSMNNKAVKNDLNTTFFNAVIEGQQGGTDKFKEVFDIEKVKGRFVAPGENSIVFPNPDGSGDLIKITSKQKKYIEPLLNTLNEETAVHQLVSKIGIFQNSMSFLLTRANPAFKVVSIVRDFIEGNLNAIAMGSERLVLPHNIIGSAASYHKFLRGSVDNSKYAEATKIAFEFGVVQETFAGNIADVSGITNALKNNDNFTAFVKRADEYFETSERSTRIALVKSFLDQGFTPLKAAGAAKKALLNFDLKGKLSKKVGPLYVFFNAINQGNNSLAMVLRDPKAATALLAATTGSVLLQEEMNSLAEPDWKRFVDSYELSSNMIFVLGTEYDDSGKKIGVKTIKIPLPLAFKPFWSAEQNALAVASGEMKLGDAASKFGVELANMLSPTGNTVINESGEGSSLAGILSPTVLKPITEIYKNENFFGSPIVKQVRDSEGNLVDSELPDHFGDDLSEKVSKKMSEFIESVVGDESRNTDPRWINQILKGWFYMGVIKDADKAVQAIDNLQNGGDVEARDIPVLNKFYGSTNKNTQWVRDEDAFIRNLNIAKTEAQKQEALFEEVLLSSGDNYLSYGKESVARENGINVPDITVNSFSLSDKNSDWVKYLMVDVPESGRDDLIKMKEGYLKTLANKKPTQYKNYLEWEVSINGVGNGTDAQIKAYFSDRGVTLDKVSRTVLQDKNNTYNRLISDRNADYSSIEQATELMNDAVFNGENFPSQLIMQEALNKNEQLVADGMLRKKKYESRKKSLLQTYDNQLFTFYKNKYSSGEITLADMVQSIRSSERRESIDLMNNFIRVNSL